MKIIRIILFGILVILSSGCENNNDSGFLVNGKINGFPSDYIYLKYGDFIDSTLVENNAFVFKGKTANPIGAIFFPGAPSSKEQMGVASFMLENSIIDIHIKYSVGNSNAGSMKFLEIDSINGSKSHVLRTHFEAKVSETVYNGKNDSITKTFLFNNLYEFLSDNPRSVMSGEFLADLNRSNNYLNGKQIRKLLKLIDTSYQEKRDLKSIRKTISKREMFDIGNTPPNIVLPDQEGNLINRANLNGKIVLLEFWASWCVPCRQVNPELLKVYTASKNKDFEILGISVDKDIDQWKAAIKKDNIKWMQVIDTLRVTENTFNLNSIPFNLLLDREGKIMAQNVKPIDLRNILAKEL